MGTSISGLWANQNKHRAALSGTHIPRLSEWELSLFYKQSQICFCWKIVWPSFCEGFAWWGLSQCVIVMQWVWAVGSAKPLKDLQNCKCQLKLLRPQVLESIWDEIGVKVCTELRTKKWFLNSISIQLSASIIALFIGGSNLRIIFNKLIWLVERSKPYLLRFAEN